MVLGEQDVHIELPSSWGGHRTGALGWPDLAMEIGIICAEVNINPQSKADIIWGREYGVRRAIWGSLGFAADRVWKGESSQERNGKR